MISKKPLMLFTFLGSIGISALAFYLSLIYIRNLAEQRFESEASRVKQSFVEKAAASELLADNLQSFTQIVPDLTREAFQTIMEGVMENYSFVRSANLYRMVQGSTRVEHEAWLAANTDTEHLVDSKQDDPDSTIPAEPGAYYLSLIYADRKSEDNTVFGWNALSDSRRQLALELAKNTGKASASDGFLLDDGHAAIEVFVPFYSGGKIPNELGARQAKLAGVIGMTIDLPLLLGDEEWRKNVTVMLSTRLAGREKMSDLYRSLDREAEGVLLLGTLQSQVEMSRFGQGLRLIFNKDLYVSRMNYGVLLIVGAGCLGLTLLALQLAKTLMRLAQSIKDLAALNVGLEQKVVARTLDLAQTNAEIQEILDNLDDGILLLDESLQIEARFSVATPEILGVADLTGRSIKDLLFAQLDPLSEEVSRHNFTLPMLFGADDFQWSIAHDNLLRSMAYRKPLGMIEAEVRQFSLRYAPLFNNQGNIQRILVVISDVTEVLALRRTVETSKTETSERMSMLMELIQADRQAMQIFMQEALVRTGVIEKDIQNLDPLYPLSVLQAIFREVHTFKGNARMVKLQTLAKAAHILEDLHIETALNGSLNQTNGGDIFIEAMEDFILLINRYQATWQELFGAENGSDRLALAREELIGLLDAGFSGPALAAILVKQNRQDVFSFLELWQSYQGMVNEIAEELGKELRPLQLDGNGYFLTATQSPLKDALTHLVRNALDHGIESPEQRRDAGKESQAELKVSLNISDSFLFLTMSDDGRGANIEKIWSLAQVRGLVAQGSVQPPDKEVLEILFHPGFSTKEKATDISGRGVGLDAVRSILREADCRIEVSTQKGLGTQFTIIIPLAKVAAVWNPSGLSWYAEPLQLIKAS